MSIIAVNTRSVRVSAAFELIDELTGLAPISPVTVRVAGVDQIATVKDSGYNLFLDLPESEYEVLIEARDYSLAEPVFFNPASLNLLQEVVTLTLTPGVNYPFPADTTLLFGSIVDEQGMSVAGARVEVMGGPHDGAFATTDVSGRCVLFFDESDASRTLNLTVSKASYDNKSVAVTIFREQAVSFVSELNQIGGPNEAVLRGRVLDVANFIVSQAQVSVSPWGVSAQTDSDGRYLIEHGVSANENVTLTVSQAGFSNQSVALNAIQGGIVDTPVVMNLNLQAGTACLGVEVVSGGAFIEGALVEIVEKSRAALSNADGLTRYYFNDLARDKETVTICVRKVGYKTKIVTRTIRRGRSVRQTVRLQAE
jgi:protocatechuate 3,4-dioxygenase beta subunit